MRHKYNTDCLNQGGAIGDFLLNRDNIERMHKSKIKVIKMTRQPFFLPVCWKVIYELSEEKGHLIVENNTLKESNQSLSMLGTDLVSANETVRKEFFRADKNKDMWREKAEEYRSALEEIREIAEKYKDMEGCRIPLGAIKMTVDEVLNVKH